jgi:hypothetical protein
LSLMQALQVGARNSPAYQSRKEDVFRAALDLDLERNEFRNIFTSQVASLLSTEASSSETVSGTVNSADAGLGRKLQSGKSTYAGRRIIPGSGRRCLNIDTSVARFGQTHSERAADPGGTERCVCHLRFRAIQAYVCG